MKTDEDASPSSSEPQDINKRGGQNDRRSGESGLEKGDGGDEDAPPKPVHFFHHSLRELRLEVGYLWLRTILILCTFIFAVLSLYWAVLYHLEHNTSSLDVFVVDFDGTQAPYTDIKPLIGPLVMQTSMQMLSKPEPHLGYVNRPTSDFANDPMQVRQAVYDFHAYAAIIVNANATALLQAAVDTGNASYDPLGACQVVYLPAREQDTYYDYIIPELDSLQTMITSEFGQMWARTVMTNNSITRDNLQTALQALNPAIGFSQYNLRPFSPAVTIPSVSVGLIYLIILSFFSFSFFLPVYTKFIKPEGHPPIPFWELTILRYLGATGSYFFMSLAYSLISLAFQIPFSNASAPDTMAANNANTYGRGTFVVFWMINFVGMFVLGLACENVTMVIGQPWTAMWLIFWVISNVSTSFYNLDLAPKFYYWGYAWPLHNIVEASRGVIFNLHSRIGLNFGVLFAWAAVNTALFPLCCWFMRWKEQRAQKKS